MTVTQESTTTSTAVTAQPAAAAKFGRFGRVAAIAALTLTMAAGTMAAAGSAQAAVAAPVTVPVTQYAACNGGDDTAGLKTAIAALKTGDTLTIPAGVTCQHSDVLELKTPGVHLS